MDGYSNRKGTGSPNCSNRTLSRKYYVLIYHGHQGELQSAAFHNRENRGVGYVYSKDIIYRSLNVCNSFPTYTVRWPPASGRWAIGSRVPDTASASAAAEGPSSRPL